MEKQVHIINCNEAPREQNGWLPVGVIQTTGGEGKWDTGLYNYIAIPTQLHTTSGGIVVWDPDEADSFLERHGRRAIEGEVVDGKLVYDLWLRANVLDYLLDHQELIPEHWKDKWIMFWGSPYQSRDGGVVLIRSLVWLNDQWVSQLYWH